MKKLRHTAFSLLMAGTLANGCAAIVGQNEVPPIKVYGSAQAGHADAARKSARPDSAEMERRLQSLRAKVAEAQKKVEALRRKYGIKVRK